MAEYIDREAIRDVLYDNDAITMLGVKLLNQILAADVTPVRHGEWIPDGEYGETTYRCSRCGHGSYYGKSIFWFYYCPNCGARMDDAPTIIEAEGVDE